MPVEETDPPETAEEAGSLGAEHLGPFVERQVRGPQGRAALVALAEDLEQQLGAGLGQRHVAELVNDQELGAGKPLLEPEELFFVACLHQLMNERSGGGKADAEALLTGRQPESEGNVGLAGTAVAERVPLDWAMTQDNLGNALLILGERKPGTARLEEAVAAYRGAVEVFEEANAEFFRRKAARNLSGAEARLRKASK